MNKNNYHTTTERLHPGLVCGGNNTLKLWAVEAKLECEVDAKKSQLHCKGGVCILGGSAGVISGSGRWSGIHT